MAYIPPNPNGQTQTGATAAPVTLPLDQDGTLQGILLMLEILVGKIPLLNAASQLRVIIEAATAANISNNVAQFGGTNVSTGTGAGGTGIPRVTVSNDSSLAANQSVKLDQTVGGVSALTAVQAWQNGPVQTLLQGLAVTGGP
jgi:hypothetical protein